MNNERAKRIRIRNRALIDAAKDTRCVDCWELYPSYVMEFDHVHGVKKRGVGSMLQSSLSALEAEIAKCEVVCSNCHRERTHRRRKEKLCQRSKTLV